MTGGFTRREISSDGVRLSYLDNDAPRPVVVLLHGLAGAGDEFTATVSAVGGRYRFILLDGQVHHDTHPVPPGNYVIAVGNYVSANPSDLGNYVSADSLGG